MLKDLRPDKIQSHGLLLYLQIGYIEIIIQKNRNKTPSAPFNH